MSLHYYIATDAGPMAMAWHTSRRADSAKQALLSQVYQAIKATAGLDTQWGHDAMTKARALEICAPKPGYTFDWIVKVQHHTVRVLAYRL